MNHYREGQYVTAQNGRRHSALAFLATGLGIGAALSFFFAPKSGEETRRWIADKYFDTIDAANEKIRRSRTRVKEVMDRGQEQVAGAVAAHRGVAAKPPIKPQEGASASKDIKAWESDPALFYCL